MSRSLLVACTLAELAFNLHTVYADSRQIHKVSCSHAALMLHWPDVSKANCVNLVVESSGLSKLLLSGGEGDKDVELLEFHHSDERISLLQLGDYNNPTFMGPRHGEAIHIVFPEKSSAVIFWNVETNSPKVFWEND